MRQLSVSIRKPSELTDIEREAWNAFLDADIRLASPYFALAFAECCEEVRADTRILVIRRSGQLIGFLPFHTGRFGVARPLAGPMGDVHGFIAARDEEISLQETVEAAGIGVFKYHSALASQTGFAEPAEMIDGSWIVDTSNGYDAWLERRREVNKKYVRNLRTRRHRLEDAEGGFEFRMDDRTEENLAQLISWKRQQYARTGLFDTFSVDWTGRLLAAVMRRRSDRFSGVCSTLSIGGRVAAVHVGMASDRMCHYWFPAYDHGFAGISPGLLLMVEMIRTAADLGHVGVELGPGDYAFKKDLAGFQTGLAAGCVTSPSWAKLAHLTSTGVADVAARLPLGSLAQWPHRMLSKIERLSGYYGL